MTLLSHERYCREIIVQNDLVRAALRGADLSATVPTCPDWTLTQLALHLSGAHRGVAEIVRNRVTEFTVPNDVPGTEGDGSWDADTLDAWLAEGARMVAEALAEAGPDVHVWTFGREQNTAFWARRMTHETAMHRADAFAAVGADYTLDAEVAADCLDEWLEIISTPQALAFKPELVEMAAPGRTLHLHATDTDTGLNAEWLIDSTTAPLTWRRAHEKAAVAVRGTMSDVLRVVYRRLPADGPGVEVLGDREALDAWLEKASF
ncbi:MULTISPECIES: maleylpyruvate isomerase family mycothiol-dependent enzyme [Streptomyces]|uniref:Maleylpyruvate isomerase family mycothiol-dependent enzyme n=1 Tax=Streptomyces griseocarneus TaxID=51201 RepID=A0ABX7RHU1_9ACTN|nr:MULTISPECIES: maleylpyruvate isomerase family mycothiol-dependent enzyme [Streptomyces]QSY47794.1 maleylpyruvate isomerase family mycothiol-dependent enzyme [Streptomyces griseocarneus]